MADYLLAALGKLNGMLGFKDWALLEDHVVTPQSSAILTMNTRRSSGPVSLISKKTTDRIFSSYDQILLKESDYTASINDTPIPFLPKDTYFYYIQNIFQQLPHLFLSLVTCMVSGADPVMVLNGPIPATQKVLKKNLAIKDMDEIEINEAFAPDPLAWSNLVIPDWERVLST
jgi:hypothetical protein